MARETFAPLGDVLRQTVDVVIPMRDGASTILVALASVLRQTLPPQRIFIVDDGSTDGGAVLVRSHRFPTVNVIEIPARGVSHARNTGIAASQADFIAFLDCDDQWAPDKLRQQLDVVRNHPDVSVVHCGSLSLDMQFEPIAGTLHSPNLRGHVFEATLRQSCDCGGLASSILVRRSALLKVGCFDEALDFAEDVDLWLRLAHNHVFDYCPAPLAYIVEHHSSTTRRPSSPARSQEILIQSLSALEKWIGEDQPSPWILAFAARSILAHAVRRRLPLNDILNLRKALHRRVPKLAHHIARTRVELIAAIGAAGVVYLPSLYSSWKRRRRRYSSMRLDHATINAS